MTTKTEGEDFSLHERPSKRGPVFYCQFRKDDGTWSTAKSTHVRVGRGKRAHDEALKEATAWAQSYLLTGQVVSRERGTFETFAEGFFDWNGEWAREKRRRGHRISQEQCDKHAQSIKNHVLPYFGKMRIARIDDDAIRKFQEHLEDAGLKGGTINRVTVALRVVLKAAYRKKMMRRMPIVEAVSERDRKDRGTFLPDEIRALFAADWPDRRCFIANKTAAATGLRASEIAELRETKIHPDYLEVDQRWSPRYKEGPTKTGKPRIVPIPSVVYRDLAELIKENPHKGDGRYVFYSIDPAHPMNQREFTEALVERMKAIGISDDPNWQKEGRAPLPGSRQARGLDFHAWRHTYNSLLVDSRVPLQTIQSVTGHLSDEMTQRYYHIGGEAGEGIRRIAEGIFAESKRKREGQSSRRIQQSKTRRRGARR